MFVENLEKNGDHVQRDINVKKKMGGWVREGE